MARQTSETIIERKTRLDGTVSEYRCERLSLDADRRAVLRYVMDREWVIGDTGIVLRPGQITIAHYWADRPYNVYHWLDGVHTIAYYCNVATDTVSHEDLVGYPTSWRRAFRPSGRRSFREEISHRTFHRRGGHIAPSSENRRRPRRLAQEIERETRAALGE